MKTLMFHDTPASEEYQDFVEFSIGEGADRRSHIAKVEVISQVRDYRMYMSSTAILIDPPCSEILSGVDMVRWVSTDVFSFSDSAREAAILEIRQAVVNRLRNTMIKLKEYLNRGN